MRSFVFSNLDKGIVDDPFHEEASKSPGGFAFASGMDIFREPGVVKSAQAMVTVSYGAGAAPTSTPDAMVDTADAVYTTIGYIIAGDKVLESTNGTTWNLFLTNSQGSNFGLDIWAGYVVYMAASKLGRTLINDAAAKNDSYLTIETDSEYHPSVKQGGTLKIGSNRYVASLDESFTLSSQALKLPTDYRVKSLSAYFNRVFAGTRVGASLGSVLNHDATVFEWDGIVLPSGSRLPDNNHPLLLRGMNALFNAVDALYAFPDSAGDIYVFDDTKFIPFRTITAIADNDDKFTVAPDGITQYKDTVLFAGTNSSFSPGVYQMKRGAICQSFVPAQTTPGSSDTITFGFVKSSFNNRVLIGYTKGSSHYIEISDPTSKQDQSILDTIWHRMRTPKNKRFAGIKLHLKPMAANTSVKVEYRTAQDVAWTDPNISITSSNQDDPALFTAVPRAKEIQFRLTFTTSGGNSPELLGYEPFYEINDLSR